MRRKRKAQDVDIIGMTKGIPEMLVTVVPPVLLFYVVVFLIHEALFFVPSDWSWQAAHNQAGSRQTFYVDWDARTLMALLVSFPITFKSYFFIKKLIAESRKRLSQKN